MVWFGFGLGLVAVYVYVYVFIGIERLEIGYLCDMRIDLAIARNFGDERRKKKREGCCVNREGR